MKVDCFVLAFMAAIVHVTSGELIPGRILAPRVKLENVRHVASSRGMNPAEAFEMHGHQRARHVRRAIPITNEITSDIADVSKAIGRVLDVMGHVVAIVAGLASALSSTLRGIAAAVNVGVSSGSNVLGNIIAALAGQLTAVDTIVSGLIAFMQVEVISRLPGLSGLVSSMSGLLTTIGSMVSTIGPKLAVTLSGLVRRMDTESMGQLNKIFAVGTPDSVNIPILTETIQQGDRSRRQTESFPGGRQASQTPSGSGRQPIRRSAGPWNHPGPRQEPRHK